MFLVDIMTNFHMNVQVLIFLSIDSRIDSLNFCD